MGIVVESGGNGMKLSRVSTARLSLGMKEDQTESERNSQTCLARQ